MKKQDIARQKLIIESFAKTFNSIKRVDENELTPPEQLKDNENHEYQELIGKKIYVWAYYYDNEGAYEGVITGFEVKYGKNYHTGEKERSGVGVLIQKEDGNVATKVLKPFELKKLLDYGKTERSYNSEGHKISIIK